MKQAILAVSFGTTYPDTLEKTIAATEAALAEAYPGWPVYRAFTSGMILKKLRQRDGVEIDNVAQAMARLEREGYTQVAVQSTHVMHGEEYEKMLAQLEPYKLTMEIAVGAPLLHAQSDYEAVADALLSWLPLPGDGEALVLMGHGTAHFANSAYAQMEHVLQSRCPRIYIATVEGYPTLDSVAEQLQRQPEIRRLTLAPFMLVAGDHARNDMAGGEDSWKEVLEGKGYEVACILQGLGECPAIQKLFVAHCGEAMERLRRGGKLYGVGVGPGDPELLTLKAVRVLREADVVLVPDSVKADKTALHIASAYLQNKTVETVTTPMVRDKAVVDAAYTAAADRICALLDQGRQVAFLTLGDPTVYSTYMYIHEKVLARGYDVEVVPGVPSFCAAAARLNLSLCQGSEPLLIVPASHGAEGLLDVKANKVFMKAGKSILELQSQLRDRGLLDHAAMVENCSMENERVYPHFADLTEASGYFSLVIAKEGWK